MLSYGGIDQGVEVKDEDGEGGAEKRTDYRYPGVAPLAASFPFDLQYMMGKTGPEVACRIDGVARGASQCHADDYYQ